mmetsp:Transcript_7288/g.22694  ORF Transcript_7288/g.22694 Transcript_7288/m.22694 type:complete len:272 (-) Transcript_7288:92-907(-)
MVSMDLLSIAGQRCAETRWRRGQFWKRSRGSPRSRGLSSKRIVFIFGGRKLSGMERRLHLVAANEVKLRHFSSFSRSFSSEGVAVGVALGVEDDDDSALLPNRSNLPFSLTSTSSNISIFPSSSKFTSFNILPLKFKLFSFVQCFVNKRQSTVSIAFACASNTFNCFKCTKNVSNDFNVFFPRINRCTLLPISTNTLIGISAMRLFVTSIVFILLSFVCIISTNEAMGSRGIRVNEQSRRETMPVECQFCTRVWTFFLVSLLVVLVLLEDG